jgi:dTDP-glucose 4,6-dehydratase
MKHSIVTGGAGFLGSHLCDRLLLEEHFVTCIDNLITGNVANISHLLGNRNFHFIHHDVTNYIFIANNVDYIFHFASPASPIDYFKLPIQTLKVGSLGTHKALGLAKAKKARFLLASTSEVYGDPLIHPQSESYWGNVNPVGPRGVYDEAKRFAEAITMAYHQFHNLETRIARIFNTYGERMRLEDGRAIPAFMTQALRNEDVTVFGDGSQTRSVCYVSDLIEGIFRLMMSDYSLPVNIGNPDEISMYDLAKEIIEITKSQSTIVLKALPIDDPKVRKPDISIAQKILGWNPNIGRIEGLKRTAEYFKKCLNL